MAKEANVLQRIFEKSWNCYDEQFNKILNEAESIFEWMDQVFPAAEDALNRKTVCSLPKRPHIKRRKLDKHQDKKLDLDKKSSTTSDDNEEPEVVEAKKPRQLRPRANAKAKTRRSSSKGPNSKRNQKNIAPQAVRPTRLTRASYRQEVIRKSAIEQDVCSANEDLHLEDEVSTAAESNTTKSFLEHEKDIGFGDEIKEITSKCLAVSLDEALIDSIDGSSKESEDPAPSSNEHIKENIIAGLRAENELHVVNDEKSEDKENLVPENKLGDIHRNKEAVIINKVEQKSLLTLSDEKAGVVSNSQKIFVDDGNGKTEDGTGNCTFVIEEKNGDKIEKDKEVELNTESSSKSYLQGQIAKIKERLFEKIALPSCSTPTRQSPRLLAGGQSPRLMTGRQSPHLMSGGQSPRWLTGGQSPKLMTGGQSARLGKSPIRFEFPETVGSPGTREKLLEQNMNRDDEMDHHDDDDDHDDDDVVSTEVLKEQSGQEGKLKHGEKVVENGRTEDASGASQSSGPTIFKPIKPKNLVTGVHSMIRAANQRCNALNQSSVTKQGNIVTGVFSFIKSNATEKKAETIQERKQRMEEEAKKREEARMKSVQQAEQRRQKEIEERKKRRLEREQRVAELQAKKAQEEKERKELTQKRFEMMKKNEEKIRKNKEKEEELKRKIREKKVAEAEAKRKQEEQERLAKMAEKEEEERRKAEYQQRKQEYEEMERKKKIEEQKKADEQRYEEHAKEMQLQEERLRREIEEREAQVRKRLEEKEKDLKEIQERKRIEKERQDKEEHERLKKEEQERLKKEEQEQLRKEEQERLKRYEQMKLKRQEQERLRKEMVEREKAKKEQTEELQERIKREQELKENERKLKEKEAKQLRELKEKKEKALKAIKENEIKEREAYYRKKLEQKQFGEPKRTFDKAELEIKQPSMQSPVQPVSKSAQQKGQKVQCTSYNTPTLTRVTSQKNRSPSLQNYDITSLSEDDSTDDEEDPAQEIPAWAKGTNFKRAILAQLQSNLDPREIFIDMLDPPKLEKMFPRLRARFFKRTSSACWDQPPRPFNTMLH